MSDGIYNSKDIKCIVGDRLRKAREAALGKGSRQKLCDLLQNHPKAGGLAKNPFNYERLKQWELGKNPISVEWIPIICDVLNCDAGYLFGIYEESKFEYAKTCASTGLHQNSILSLQEIISEDKVVREVVYSFLDDLIDSFLLESIAINYHKFKHGDQKSETYSIIDGTGRLINMGEGDVSLIALQNALTHFIQSNSNDLSRSERRKFWNGLTDEEKADLAADYAWDLQQGK